MNKAWTNKEEQILQKNYPKGGIKLCQKKLDNRTWDAIKHRAQKLGIKRKKEDLTGQLFTRWFVESYNPEKSKEMGKAYWNVICTKDGNKGCVSANNLKSGQSKSCGCLRKEKLSERQKRKREDLTGKRFGRYTVIKYNPEKSKEMGISYWDCICDCGTEKCVSANHLKKGNTRSCGCLFKEIMQGKTHPKYKGIKTSEYMLNLQIGLLTVQKEVGEDTWECSCKCGNICIRKGDSLRGGDTNSCGCLRRKSKLGEKNPAWKGGVTSFRHSLRTLSEYDKWRKEVFERDHFTCQKCKENKSGNLVAHHKIPLFQLIEENSITTLEQAILCKFLWDISNGVTLCTICHTEYHSLYGMENGKKMLNLWLQD